MFHGIEELTKDGQGYIYWKGKHVEHYSFRGEDAEAREAEAAHDLADRCRHLENIGVPVSMTAAVWNWEVLKGITQADDPLIELFRVKVYESTARDAIIVRLHDIDKDTDEPTRQVWHKLVGGRWTSDVEVIAAWFNVYRVLRPTGWDVPHAEAKGGATAYSSAEALRSFWNRHGITSIADLRAALNVADVLAMAA